MGLCPLPLQGLGRNEDLSEEGINGEGAHAEPDWPVLALGQNLAQAAQTVVHINGQQWGMPAPSINPPKHQPSGKPSPCIRDSLFNEAMLTH